MKHLIWSWLVDMSIWLCMKHFDLTVDVSYGIVVKMMWMHE